MISTETQPQIPLLSRIKLLSKSPTIIPRTSKNQTLLEIMVMKVHFTLIKLRIKTLPMKTAKLRGGGSPNKSCPKRKRCTLNWKKYHFGCALKRDVLQDEMR